LAARSPVAARRDEAASAAGGMRPFERLAAAASLLGRSNMSTSSWLVE